MDWLMDDEMRQWEEVMKEEEKITVKRKGRQGIGSGKGAQCTRTGCG